MWETIIAVIITGLVSIITTLISAKGSREKMTTELDKRLAVTDNEITHLKDQMQEMKANIREHNGYAKMFATYSTASDERFKTVFSDMKEIKEDIKALKEKGA